MTTIFERVNTALSALSPAIPFASPVYESTATLPDVFINFQLLPSYPVEHADNLETHRLYTVQVSIFSRVGLVSLPNVDAAMSAQGFTKGPMRQLPKDPLTGHHGLAIDYHYLDKVL